VSYPVGRIEKNDREAADRKFSRRTSPLKILDEVVVVVISSILGVSHETRRKYTVVDIAALSAVK